MVKKHPNSNLRAKYQITFQFSLILCLAFFLALTNIKINPSLDNARFTHDDIELNVLVDLPPTIPPKTPPTPPKPMVTIEVVDDTPIEDFIDFPEIDIMDYMTEIPLPPEVQPTIEIYEDYGVEVSPTMIGGLKELYQELEYPEMAKRAGIEGLVTVQFIVNKEGNVEQPEILRGIGGGCDQEVLRVIRLMKFSPGVQNGNFVSVRMAQSVRFKLQN